MEYVIPNPNPENMYQNQGFSFNRTERKTLIIDHMGDIDNVSFKLPLYEPLLIDKLSDVYLESFTTFNSASNSASNVKAAFVISIDEFNINSNSNLYYSGCMVTVVDLETTNVFNNIIIPNESASDTGTFIHKSKKLNYICSINPIKLGQITIKITGLDGEAMFTDQNGRFILELVFIARY